MISVERKLSANFSFINFEDPALLVARVVRLPHGPAGAVPAFSRLDRGRTHLKIPITVARRESLGRETAQRERWRGEGEREREGEENENFLRRHPGDFGASLIEKERDREFVPWRFVTRFARRDPDEKRKRR